MLLPERADVRGNGDDYERSAAPIDRHATVEWAQGLARAFDPFTRADGGRTRPGAGLGLAIVATVADAHAGRVRLHDGRPGTAVVLTLPVSAPAARSRDSR